jgi:hypothetical protein
MKNENSPNTINTFKRNKSIHSYFKCLKINNYVIFFLYFNKHLLVLNMNTNLWLNFIKLKQKSLKLINSLKPLYFDKNKRTKLLNQN